MSAVVIVVVDDDDSLRSALGRFLRSAGHAVEVFGSAEEFLEAGVADRAGCVILDTGLPEMSGPELFERLEALPSRPPVIFMTARRDDRLRRRLIDAGALEVLFKPFDGDLLLALIAEALRPPGR